MNEKFTGISASEAQERLQKYGRNELPDQDGETAFRIVIHQFKNFLVLLLFIAAIISALAGETIDAGIILFILVLNIVFGFVQEFKAEHAIASLKKMTMTQVRVIRDGEEQMIDSKLLVPGDIIRISEGDKIPADGIVREAVRCEVNEAALTGESLPVPKSPHEKNNRVCMGTIVSAGRATIEITHTGLQTKFGSMATSLSEIEKKDTPLTQKITKLGMQLSVGAFAITSVLFLIGLLRQLEVVEMLLTSISLLIAAVPEGLPAVITITLAVGLQRMSRQKAILRKLGAIEALGNTTIIATDKTGTLTENKMRVVEIWTKNNGLTDELVKCGIICNDAKIVSSKSQNPTILGDQTEGSLLIFAQDNGSNPEKILRQGKRVDEFLFDSNRKLMSVLWSQKDQLVLYSKGAPEQLLNKSTKILVSGKQVALTASGKKEIEKAIESAASKGLRVLALARRETKSPFSSRDAAEKDLVFLGFVSIADPPRKDVKDVIEQARRAGIQTIMITGDNPLTAAYIAKEVGLLSDSSCVVTGSQLAAMTDDELSSRLETASVFARTTPEDKFRIVRVLQKKGHIVTVTGDGVNDALALKQANVGVAMGITGTDVAKEVADMVIMDDHFASIVHAVREGRIIFDNIVTSVSYLVACNLGEVLLIFVAIAFGYPAPLLPIQILWVNLITDGLPALSLAFDPGSLTVMTRPSSGSRTAILNRSTVPMILEYGAIVSLIPLAFYFMMSMTTDLATARTSAFTSLVITQMVAIFFIRGSQPLVSNKLLLLAVGLSLLLQYLIISVPPLAQVFHVLP